MQEMPERAHARMQGRESPGRAIVRFCMPAVLGVLVSAVLASGCATATAKSAADTPALEVPAPPPRTVETADTEPQTPATLPDEPSRRAPAVPPRRQQPPPAPRPETREQPKPEPPVTPAVDPKPSEPPKTL